MTDCQKSTRCPAQPAPPLPSAVPGGPSAPGAQGAIPPPHAEDWLVFRESFLVLFEPEARATLRAAGDVLYTRILSGDMPREREPWTHARLRALALDLRFAAQFLTELADEPNHSECADPEETRLQHQCPSWAQTARALAVAIEEAVGPAPPQ